MSILDWSFYSQSTALVARQLLGKYLVKNSSGLEQIIQISETEAYIGPQDLAAHSRSGITQRNQVMFGPPGFAYVFQVYGMYYCFNIVTEPAGHGSAVLIRAGLPIKNITGKISGPGLLCRELNITTVHNGLDLTRGGELYIVDAGISVADSHVANTPRIGINYAGSWKDKLLRYEIVSVGGHSPQKNKPKRR